MLSMDGLVRLPSWAKLSLKFVVDLACLTASFFCAMILRLEDFTAALQAEPWAAFGLSLPLGLLAFVRLGLYRTVVRHVSARAVQPIVIGVIASAVGVFVSGELLNLYVPLSVPAIYAIFGILAVGASRFLFRAAHRAFLRNRQVRVLIYGAGRNGRSVLQAIKSENTERPIAFIDDDPALQGKSISGLPVFGVRDLHRIIDEMSVTRVMLALPGPSGELARRRLEDYSVQIVDAIQGREPGIGRLTPEEQFARLPALMRDRTFEDAGLRANRVTGQIVVITGAAGTIGQALAQEALRLEPRALVLIDTSVDGLNALHRMLCPAIPQDEGTRISLLPGSITDDLFVGSVFERFSPDIVFNAASVRSLALAETALPEIARTNVIGRRILAEAALAHGVTSVVSLNALSEDGCTTDIALCERAAWAVCPALQGRSKGTAFLDVAFMEAVRPEDTVVPMLQAQIEAGGPIVLPHRDFARRVLLTRHAASLVLQAAGIGNHGETLFIDPGAPLTLSEVAKDMIAQAGLAASEKPQGANEPNTVVLSYRGLRPREAMTDASFVPSDASPTPHPNLVASTGTPHDWVVVGPLLDGLDRACTARNPIAIRVQLSELSKCALSLRDRSLSFPYSGPAEIVTPDREIGVG